MQAHTKPVATLSAAFYQFGTAAKTRTPRRVGSPQRKPLDDSSPSRHNSSSPALHGLTAECLRLRKQSQHTDTDTNTHHCPHSKVIPTVCHHASLPLLNLSAITLKILCFVLYTVVGKGISGNLSQVAGFSAIKSSFNHLRGCSCICICRSTHRNTLSLR